MRFSRLVLVPALAGGLATGCSPARGFCEAHADCDREFLGIVIPDAAGDADDSLAVCTLEQEGRIRALRANEEAECQEAAEKMEVYMACIGAAFGENPDGCDVLEDDCGDELDDMNDALADIDGNECSSSED
jgi:hypothetical protein